MTTTLVVAAHPDDEVLGCGGTMARLVQEGRRVVIAILGEGLTSRAARREETDASLLEGLRGHSQAAARALGVTEVRAFALPDNRFDTVPLLEVVKIIEGLIEEYRPEEIFTQHGGDLNVDHVVTYRATLTATRPMAGCPVRAVYSYEVASSTEWAFHKFSPAFHPQLFIDIGTTLERKVQAMQAYESEARPFPHPRSPEALRAIATRWGSVVGVTAAEAFEVVRWVR